MYVTLLIDYELSYTNENKYKLLIFHLLCFLQELYQKKKNPEVTPRATKLEILFLES